MQRLFSTFAAGWPGIGLLIQRFLIGTILLREAFLRLEAGPHFALVALPLIASVLLVIGLGTPYIGLLVAATQLWLVFAGSADPWPAIIVCGLGISLAMIGPGAWSVDARLFGRKHVEIVKKQRCLGRCRRLWPTVFSTVRLTLVAWVKHGVADLKSSE